MNITVQFKGRYQDITGEKQITLSTKKNATIWDIIEQITLTYPPLKKDKKFMMISRNNTFTTIHAPIKEGDIVTIAPPVVGGG